MMFNYAYLESRVFLINLISSNELNNTTCLFCRPYRSTLTTTIDVFSMYFYYANGINILSVVSLVEIMDMYCTHEPTERGNYCFPFISTKTTTVNSLSNPSNQNILL